MLKPPGVAQKQLRLRARGKKKTLDPVYRPLPQVTKTSLYDEHWAAKQERGTIQILSLSALQVLYCDILCMCRVHKMAESHAGSYEVCSTTVQR